MFRVSAEKSPRPNDQREILKKLFPCEKKHHIRRSIKGRSKRETENIMCVRKALKNNVFKIQQTTQDIKLYIRESEFKWKFLLFF